MDDDLKAHPEVKGCFWFTLMAGTLFLGLPFIFLLISSVVSQLGIKGLELAVFLGFLVAIHMFFQRVLGARKSPRIDHFVDAFLHPQSTRKEVWQAFIAIFSRSTEPPKSR